MLEHIRNISAKLVDQKLYAVFGPVFDYDSDGRVDTDLTKARCEAYITRVCIIICIRAVGLKYTPPCVYSMYTYGGVYTRKTNSRIASYSYSVRLHAVRSMAR